MAISLKLIPAIDEAVLIAVPEWHTTSSSVELRFSAVLDDDELQQLKKDGVKVQVWSDIPAGGRTEGDWGEIELHEVVSDGSSDVSLVTLGDDNNLNTFLSAVCSVPYPSKDFSFTYRLVYPSGHVQWLGYFGRNGTIHFERTSSDISGVVFGEGWTTMRSPFTWNTRGRLVEDVPIVRLVSPEEWTIWSLGKDSFCEGATNEASLLFLVPRLRPYAIYCPRTLILSASLDTSISVSAAGHIHASGEGSLFLQTFEPSLGSIDSFLDSVLGPTHLEYQLLGIFKHYIVLTSAGSSVQAIIIPLLPQAFASHIAISSESLARILSAETPEYTIFAPARHNVWIVDSVTCESGLVTFHVPPCGGLFTLSPLYSIPTASGNHLSVTVLFPHSIAEDAAVDDTVLPTPPMSPLLKPIAHLTATSHPNLSSSSISDLDVQDILPEALSSTDEPDSLVPDSVSSPAARSTNSLARQTSSSVPRSSREDRSNVPFMFMRHVCLILTFWFSVFFRKLWGGSAHAEPHAEPTPPQPGVAKGAQDAGVEESTLSVVPVPDIPIVLAPSPSSTVFLPPSAPLSVVKFDLLDEKPEPRGLILRDTSGSVTKDNLSDAVIIEVNGQGMDLINVISVQEGVFYFEVDWVKSGRLVIRLIPSLLVE